MFNGMGGMGNMAGMMKKIQKMQSDMTTLQEDLKKRTLDVSVGGGAVAVTVTGKKELASIKIDPAAVDTEDMEILQDLIVSAVNEGMRQIDEMTEKEMSKITGGIKLPGM